MKVLVTYRQICVSLLMMMVVLGVETVGYSQADPDMREGSAVVSVVPAEIESPAAGEALAVNINITGGTDVAGYEATLQFDATALRYVESAYGDYLPTGAFVLPPTLTGNTVTLGAASLTGATDKRNGVLATITFEVIAAKASTLTLSDVTLANSASETLDLQVKGSQIQGVNSNNQDLPEQEPSPPVQDPTGTTKTLVISSGNHQRGIPDMPLKKPLIVRVLDADTTGVANVRVIFRVMVGQGRLSTRGNGRAVKVFTNSRGFASAAFTPARAGTTTVHVSASGVNGSATFIVTTDLAPPAARTYNAGDKIPLSTGSTLNFSGSRTVNGTTYTCVGPGECVISHGLVTKGEIRSAAAPTVQAKAYQLGQEIPIRLNDTLTFTNSYTVNEITYTCVGPGECVVSHGLVTKGEIRVSTKNSRTTAIHPVAHVAEAQRPPMLWIDEGAIYTLVGETVERFVPSVNNALHITVGGNKVYWTEITRQNAGTINSANLNGSNVQELVAIQAIPMGIAVDTGARKLYWTNSRGRIQTANLDGSNSQNMLQNLDAEGFPTDITVDRGIVYWIMVPTQAESPKIGVVTPTRREVPKYISTRSPNIPRSLAVSGGKVYWTEETGAWQPITASESVFIPDGRGTINTVNLNFTGATQLASILSMPVGIAVDAARSKLYWTNSRGRIQAANLDGSGGVRNVVTGLAYPGDMVISNSIQAPASTRTTSTTPTTSKYDVNGDGTVDAKDSDALVVAIAAGITDAKYDVNADGKVDINDIVAVTANHNSGAPGAPALIGNIKLSAVQIDRLQEQIELLIATGDLSPAAIKTLIYLQQLIATARPEKTQLFANYPNPFNPETWMPYELATDTTVKITIYASNGVVVRALQLGHQSAGYYTDRERAAYWDGRNALGEQVASGIYFYQLETDELSAMRKMVILK